MQRGRGGFQKVNYKEIDKAIEKVTWRRECHGNMLLDVSDQSSHCFQETSNQGARDSRLSPHPPSRGLRGRLSQLHEECQNRRILQSCPELGERPRLLHPHSSQPQEVGHPRKRARPWGEIFLQLRKSLGLCMVQQRVFHGHTKSTLHSFSRIHPWIMSKPST